MLEFQTPMVNDEGCRSMRDKQTNTETHNIQTNIHTQQKLRKPFFNLQVFFSPFFNYSNSLIIKKAVSNILRLRFYYRGLVFCIVLCEDCGFVKYLSFKCEMPGFLVLYSRTKMLKLINIAKMLLKRH